MDRELKNLTLNISQLAALSGVHRQTAAARLQNLPVAGGHESNLKLYRVVDIVSAFLALPPPVAEGEMDAHERKAWYQSERERLKFEQETAQLIPASDVRREFAVVHAHSPAASRKESASTASSTWYMSTVTTSASSSVVRNH